MWNGISLDGQVALVTGGGRRLGRSFAEALAQAGASVAITARTRSKVEETAQAITDAGGRCLPFEDDVSDPQSMEAVVRETERVLGPVDLLVNNAGVVTPLGNDWEADPESWWRLFEINVKGQFNCIRLVLPGMMERKSGRIINISSRGAYTVHPYAAAYCASNAARSEYTRCLAPALQPYGITVLAFAPAGVTDMIEQLASDPGVPAERRERFRNRIDTQAETELALTLRMFMALASGRLDALAGRHVSHIDVPEELEAHMSEIVEQDLYAIRIWKLPASAT